MRFECAVCRVTQDTYYMEESSQLAGILKVCRYCISLQMAKDREPAPIPQYRVTTHAWHYLNDVPYDLRRGHWMDEYEKIRCDKRYNQDYSVSPIRVGGVRTKFKKGKIVS